MGQQTSAHQQKRLDERTRIPAMFRVRRSLANYIYADSDSVDEAAAPAQQQLPEVSEGRRPIEQLCLHDIPRDVDALLAVHAVRIDYNKSSYNILYTRQIYKPRGPWVYIKAVSRLDFHEIRELDRV